MRLDIMYDRDTAVVILALLVAKAPRVEKFLGLLMFDEGASDDDALLKSKDDATAARFDVRRAMRRRATEIEVAMMMDECLCSAET